MRKVVPVTAPNGIVHRQRIKLKRVRKIIAGGERTIDWCSQQKNFEHVDTNYASTQKT